MRSHQRSKPEESASGAACPSASANEPIAEPIAQPRCRSLAQHHECLPGEAMMERVSREKSDAAKGEKGILGEFRPTTFQFPTTAPNATVSRERLAAGR